MSMPGPQVLCTKTSELRACKHDSFFGRFDGAPSGRAHEHPVEDYASVMLRSASGILGTVEVGNGFPRDGTDGEWKIAGRDAILTMKDGITKLATAEGDETFPGATVTSPYFTALRDVLDHWRRGAAPPISVHDCARAVQLIDQAYKRAS
jgi:predicted dehydrogenase